MYSDRWSPALRQGDIIGPINVPLVGNGKSPEVTAKLVDVERGSTDVAERWIINAAPRLVTVISHDCEFNEGKRDRLLVARMTAPTFNRQTVSLEEVIASNDVDGRQRDGLKVHGVDGWVFNPLDGVMEDHQAAAFSTIMPITHALLRQLHAAKKGELTHEQRLLFRRKLAYYFVRSDEDVPEDDKLPAAEILQRLKPKPSDGDTT